MQLTIDIGGNDGVNDAPLLHADEDARMAELNRMRKTLEFDADEIETNVYVGSLRSTSRVEELKKRNITHILNLSCRNARSLDQADSGVEQMTINILDAVHERIIQKFEESIAFIDKGLGKGGAVLICCSRGISRSVTIGCAWLMRRKGLDYKSALKTIQAVRPIAAPHFSFIGQLYVYEKTDYTVDVEESLFEKLSKEFSETVQPTELFANDLTMSLSMERAQYASEDDESGFGASRTPRVLDAPPARRGRR